MLMNNHLSISKRSVAVLGAGLQGVLVALALRRAGWRVELIDRAPAPLLGASLRGEGKIHLGYVYGNEPGRATAGLMVEGALSFATLIDRWMPKPIDWKAITSESFLYAILADTMVTPEQLSEHYQWVDDAIEERFDQGETYAGMRTFIRSKELASAHRVGFSGDVITVHSTSELAVDPLLLREELLAALRVEGITFHPNYVVKNVARNSQGFAVEATNHEGGIHTWHTDTVVNCLWDGRLAIDATMGIQAERTCLYRLKYAVNARLKVPPIHNITTTFALGPYGDVVLRSDGRLYLSWYPICLAGISKGLEPPATWLDMLNAPETSEAKMNIATATVDALAKRIPSLQDAHIESVNGGVIVAWGDSDIDHPSSELHRRHAIGVYDYDGYLSVDTGKLTTAPMFAARVADVLGSPQAWA
jgi:glycine/D-amino acid oxidase-like deaminating enzyme